MHRVFQTARFYTIPSTSALGLGTIEARDWIGRRIKFVGPMFPEGGFLLGYKKNRETFVRVNGFSNWVKTRY